MLRGLRQRDVAVAHGVSVAAVHNWERGHAEPEVRFLPRIIDFLGFCPIDPAEPLGARLRRAREARGLSLGRLAALVRVDESTVARWERGSRLVPAHSAIVTEAILAKVPFEAAGARPRDRRLTNHDPREIRRLRAAGLSLREIGQRLRVSASTVRSRLQGESESE